MAPDFTATFSALKTVFAKHAKRLSAQTDTAREYTLVTKKASPFPQHKGRPMFFSSVRLGKAYVSLHLLPLYMTPALSGGMSPGLKKRMQGKACFHFKQPPEAELMAELKSLTARAIAQWTEKKWM